MSNTGRKRDAVWSSFDEIKNELRKGIRAKCKQCGKELEGQVSRMRTHLSMCTSRIIYENENISQSQDVDDIKMPTSSKQASAISSEDDLTRSVKRHSQVIKDMCPEAESKKKKLNETTLDSYFIRFTQSQKIGFDEQVARFVYATNSSFRSVEHPEFIKLVQQLRPGYNPPNRAEVGGHLLDSVYKTEKKKCSLALKNETVCLGFDGWSNIHNEPVICVTVSTKNGDVYLVDTVDTSGKAHTADNLAEIAVASIKKCESELECFVRSVVTDNAGNVSKMRHLLQKDKELNVITYGCSAHILNLLAGDIQCHNVTEQVLKIIKYFRNNHFANACYRSANSPNSKLILPSEVRWNSMTDSLNSYIKGWPTLVKICEEHRQTIDKSIQALISNFGLKRNAEDLYKQLKPIAVALDEIQRDNCNLADAVYIWKKLKQETKDLSNEELFKKVDFRYKMALTQVHFLAYMLDPNPRKIDKGCELTDDERKQAFNFAKEKYFKSSLVPLILKLHAKSLPFQECLFDENILNEVSPYEWWKGQKNEINKFNNQVFHDIEQLFTAKASSASVERIFSTFGLVQSKLRNRLGLEKASKLVFLFKMFN